MNTSFLQKPNEIRRAKGQMFVGKHGFLNPFFLNFNQLPDAKIGFTNGENQQHFAILISTEL